MSKIVSLDRSRLNANDRENLAYDLKDWGEALLRDLEAMLTTGEQGSDGGQIVDTSHPCYIDPDRCLMEGKYLNANQNGPNSLTITQVERNANQVTSLFVNSKRFNCRNNGVCSEAIRTPQSVWMATLTGNAFSYGWTTEVRTSPTSTTSRSNVAQYILEDGSPNTTEFANRVKGKYRITGESPCDEIWVTDIYGTNPSKVSYMDVRFINCRQSGVYIYFDQTTICSNNTCEYFKKFSTTNPGASDSQEQLKLESNSLTFKKFHIVGNQGREAVVSKYEDL